MPLCWYTLHVLMYPRMYHCIIHCFTLCTDACRTPIAPDQGQWQNPLPWYLPGHILTFTCKEGYGPLQSGNVTCQFNGDWAGGQPLCTCKMLLVTAIPTAIPIPTIFDYI